MLFAKTRLAKAIRRGDLSAIRKFLEKGTPLDSWDTHPVGTCTAFHEATKSGNTDAFLFLLAHGMKLKPCYHYSLGPHVPAGRDESDYYPSLHIAAVDGTSEILKATIKASADLNVRTEKNRKTALHCLCMASQHPKDLRAILEKITLLLDYGADPNSEDSDGNTPVFDATFSHGYLDVVKLLHQRGADLMHRNKEKETVLFWADGDGVVEYLVAHGCDPMARNSIGWTALDATRFAGLHKSKEETLEGYVGA